MTALHQLKKCFKQMRRKKNLSQVTQEKSELGKVLTALDLTALGVGCTLGVGVYVLPGLVARETAGPAVIVSFFLAAVTSILAGLSFAEFGARVPKAGSAYIYSYVTMGEFVAFTIGWTLIMEYIIGTASVARGLSVYIDTLVGHQMETFYRSIYEIEGSKFLSEYFDIFSFLISIIVTMGLAYGVKESMIINNLLTFVNIAVVLFVITCGAFHLDWDNWALPDQEVPFSAGVGGFFPFGVMGAIKGASTCFYGYVGFDVISTSGEEVKNPAKSVPLSIIFSLLIVFVAYSGISGVLTLMWPYYLQDTQAPIPYAFDQVGWHWAATLVSVGGVFGLLASLFSGMFPLPRVIYSMANDGLLFRNLGEVHPKYRTPFKGTVIAGFITGIMGAAFELKHLVDLMSIATLLTYTIVSTCVLVLRYREDEEGEDVRTPLLSPPKKTPIDRFQVLQQLVTFKSPAPSRVSSAAANINIILFCLFSVILSHVLVHFELDLTNGSMEPAVAVCCLVTLMVVILILIALQPSDTSKLPFKTPWVPFVPGLSIFLNVYLMILMSFDTWVRFLVWMIAGYLIYFTYGLWQSNERRRDVPVVYDNLQSDMETLDDRPKRSSPVI
uniref:High affinity cationic amino acid transporter 1 n=1 Tax=Lygus hesperus TaxID=30085 RepID=A0A146LZQ3_LYGHE